MGRERRRRPRTRAEQLRRHREELEVALAEGLPLDAARARLASYRDHLPRLGAPIDTGLVPPPAEAERPLQWWQRD